jgi:hypothetical protein
MVDLYKYGHGGQGPYSDRYGAPGDPYGPQGKDQHGQPTALPYDPYSQEHGSAAGGQDLQGGYYRAGMYADRRNLPGNAEYYANMDRAYQGELGMARAMQSRPYQAETMQNVGLGQAQRGMQQQALARGSNPLASRAAIMGGADTQRQAAFGAANARVQEQGARNQAMLGTLGHRAQYEQMARDDATRRYLSNLGAESAYGQTSNYQAQTDAMEDAAKDANTREWFSAVAGMVGGGAGGGAMASDARNKNLYRSPAPRGRYGGR